MSEIGNVNGHDLSFISLDVNFDKAAKSLEKIINTPKYKIPGR